MENPAESIRALRLKSWALVQEVSGYAVSEQLRRVQALLVKYSAQQPRVPAGNSDGGQWTSGGGGGGPSGTPPFVPPPQNRPGGMMDDFSTQRPTGGRDGAGTPPLVPGRSPQAPTRIDPAGAVGAALGNVLGQVVGAVGDAVGSVVGTIREAFAKFGTYFDVPIEGGVVPDEVNVFIGGAGDQGDNHNVLNSDALRRGVAGHNIYATNDQENKINEAIQKLPPNVQVRLIGHSWGGDTAARVALANPGRVSVLVTVDPVTRWDNGLFLGGPNFNDVRNSVGAWVNVRATGLPNGGDGSNVIARIGGRWADNPKPYADLYVEAPYNHHDFPAMMRYDIAGGRTIQKILNRGK